MLYLFGILTVLISIALVLVVVVQNSKGGGLNSQFGGTATQVLGARRSNEFIETLTWGLAAALVVIAVIANLSGSVGGKKAAEALRLNARSIEGKAAANPTQAPAATQFQQQAAPAQGEQPAAQPK